MGNNSKSILDYRGVIQGLTQDLAKLETYAQQLEMENCKVTLDDLNKRIKDNRFNLAVLGEFRRGKSTLINALLHTPVLPSDIVPTTASVNRVTYTPDQPRAHVDYLDGTQEEIDISDLAMYATQDGEKHDNVKQVTVWYPTPYCANNVDIYDTPGLNDSAEMTNATTEVMSRMDAAIFVVSGDIPLGQSEIDFLSNRLLTADVGRVIFVVTRMDQFTPEQQQRVLDSIRQRIGKYILAKAEKVYADDAEKLAAFKSKLGDVQIFGVSSTMALKGRQEHDDALLEKSGFKAFENAIDDLLLRERGMIMLEQQTGIIAKTTTDIFNVIQARIVPLNVSEEEFNVCCEKTTAEIDKIKKELDEELHRLDDAEKAVEGRVKASWTPFIADLQQKIVDTVNGIDIPATALRPKELKATITTVWEQHIIPLITSEVQLYGERITEEINEAAEQECQNLDGYVEQLSAHLAEISLNLSFEKTTTPEVLGSLAFDFISYGGSIRSGYKIAGLKGAIVGGLSNAAIRAGAGFAALGAIALLTGGVAVPASIVCAIIASFVGSFSSKAILNAMFKKARMDKLKEEIIHTASKTLNDFATEQAIQADMLKYVSSTFSSIKGLVSSKTNDTVADLSKTMQDIQTDFAAKKANAQVRYAEYEQILTSIAQISDNVQHVRWEYGLD